MATALAEETAAPAGGDHAKQVAKTAKIPTQVPIHFSLIRQPSSLVDSASLHS
jgi:hypothetical protein